MSKNRDLKRKNVYVPAFVNDWIVEEAKKRGLNQSTLISIIIQERIKQEQAVETLGNVDLFIKELEKLKEV